MNFSRARTQAAEVRIISSSSSISFDNLDESLPCLVYDDDDDDTPDCKYPNHQSSLFSEINSLVCFYRFEFIWESSFFLRKQCQMKRLKNVLIVQQMILNLIYF